MSGLPQLPELPTSPGGVRVEHATTSGTFNLDGGSWDVENNVWVLGDDHECVVVDAPHDARPVLDLVGDRRIVAVLLTHAHDDHVSAVPGLLEARPGTEVALHPADRVLWYRTHPALAPTRELADGDVVPVGDVEVRVLHTPGHAPGACCFHVPALGVLFSGDTLFQGGPGATGRSFSDFPTIIHSLRERVLTLPVDTVVLTGHGDATRIGAEAPDLDAWVARGH